MKMLKKGWLAIGLLLSCSIFYSNAQTILYPGDLAVIGINASNSACSGSSGEDLISFVCFKDIAPGTTIDLTDNGWERLNANAFGNSEGVLRIERTGASIAAGTIITLRTQGVGGDYEIIAPDNAWTLTRLNTLGNNLNLNAGGDQLFFMQGGVWFDGTSSGFGGFSHDATYDGGRFLFAFNTTSTWDAFQDDSQNSGLPPSLSTCLHQEAVTGGTDFLAYTGPTTAATPIEWIGRITDNSNWQSFADCLAYPAPPVFLQVLVDQLRIDCKECGSCAAYEETAYFRLPENGGPFDLVYTQNTDTILAPGVVNNDSLLLAINENTIVNFLSLTDANGCPFVPEDNSGFEALIEPLSVAYQVNGSACDTSCYTLDFTFTGNGPFLLRYYYSYQDSSEARNLIALTPNRSLDICPADLPTDQGPIDLILLSVKDLNCTQELNQRIEVASGGPVVTELAETICEGEIRMVNGTIYDASNPFGQEVIPGGAANGCDSIINVALTFSSPVSGTLTGDATLCEGQSTFLTVHLEGATTYTVEIQDDQAGLLYFTNVQDGDQFEVSPNKTTTYTLTQVSTPTAGCTAQPDQSVTIAISDFDLEITSALDYGGFGVSCADATDGALVATVNGDTGPFDLSWSTGDTGSALNNLAPGTYEVTVTDGGGCTQMGTYSLAAPMPLQLQLGADSSGCGGSSSALRIEQISGGTAPYEYSVDGQFFTSISDFPLVNSSLTSGNYSLTIQDANDCQVSGAFSIGGSSSLDFDLGDNFSIASGDSTIIKAVITQEPLEINWINAEDAIYLTPLEIRVRPDRTDTYGLRLTYPGNCIVEDFITVFVEQRKDYFTPTGFSPNDDGVNETFTIFGGSQVAQIKNFRIFSRWGQLLYQEEQLDPNNTFGGWDGTYKDQPAPQGSYIFSAEIGYRNGKTEVISGSFALIR